MITTYECRVQFTGKHSRLIESKEFIFITAGEREAFKATVREANRAALSGGFDGKVVAQWEGQIYQEADKADTALLQAWLAPVR